MNEAKKHDKESLEQKKLQEEKLEQERQESERKSIIYWLKLGAALLALIIGAAMVEQTDHIVTKWIGGIIAWCAFTWYYWDGMKKVYGKTAGSVITMVFPGIPTIIFLYWYFFG